MQSESFKVLHQVHEMHKDCSDWSVWAFLTIQSPQLDGIFLKTIRKFRVFLSVPVVPTVGPQVTDVTLQRHLFIVKFVKIFHILGLTSQVVHLVLVSHLVSVKWEERLHFQIKQFLVELLSSIINFVFLVIKLKLTAFVVIGEDGQKTFRLQIVLSHFREEMLSVEEVECLANCDQVVLSWLVESLDILQFRIVHV